MSPAPLPPNLRRILDAEYPRYSAPEMARRRAAIEAALAQAGCDHLVFCGANRAGSVVQWLTQWPVTAEAVGVLTPGQRDALFLQYVNHPPLAKKLADQAEVAWGGESSIAAAIAVLEKRGARVDRVGVIGPLNFEQHAALSVRFGKVASLNRAYVRLRRVKSDEEIDWLIYAAFGLADSGCLVSEELYGDLTCPRGDRVFERARALRRTPASADDANVHSFFLPIDNVINRLDRVFGAPKPARIHELQRHDLNFPVHARDTDIVLTLRADDAGAVSAMSVLVHRI